jgi:rfaE bifunctional protein kinase chain/domain
MNYETMLTAIRQFSRLHILVLGDVMLDVYDFCYTPDSKPIDSEKSGKRAYKAQNSIKTIGGAGNVAANLAALGVATALIGITGNDGQYFTLQTLADALNVKHCLIRDVTRPTTTKMRLYLDDEYLLRRDDEETHPISHETALTIVNEFVRELDHADAVVLSDYHKGFFTEELAQRLIAIATQRNIPVIVDLKPSHKEYFRGATIIAPNRSEAEALYPGFLRGHSLEESTRTLYQQLNCRSVVVTLGEQGLCGYDGARFFHVPANRVKVVDAVGCGDTVRVGLTLGYVAGLTLSDAGELANDAAAVVVQKIGTSTVNQAELLAFVTSKWSK